MGIFKKLHLGSCFSHVCAFQHQLAMLCTTNNPVPHLCIWDAGSYLDFNSKSILTTFICCCVDKQSLFALIFDKLIKRDKQKVQNFT